MRAFGLFLLLVACDRGSPIVVYDPDAGPILEDRFDLAMPDLRRLECEKNQDCASGTYCLEQRNGCPTGDGGPVDDPPAWTCVTIDFSPYFQCAVSGDLLRCDCR